MAYDRSKYFSAGEVCKRLGWTSSMLHRRLRDKVFPFAKLIEKRWLFPKDLTERAIARLLEEEKGRGQTPGELDALACKMIREGKTDGDVIMELRLSVDHVAKLRRSLGLPPMDEPKAPGLRKPSAPTVEIERGDAFWERLAATSAARRKANST